MNGRTKAFAVATLAACCAALLSGCGRDAGGGAQGKDMPPPVTVRAVEGVQLELYLPDTMAFGQAGDVRVTVANRSGAAVSGARLQLFVQSPLSFDTAPAAAGPRPNAAPVTVDGGWSTTFALGPLAAGQAAEVVQRVRLPAAAAGDTVSVPLRVRAWVEAADGKPLGSAAEDTLLPRVPSAATCGGADVHVMRYGVGTVRLGMSADQLRGLCPGVRDTAWRAEGTAWKGFVFPVAGHPLLAALAGDSVVRVVVRDRGIATPAGVGVGSTLGDLRTRYGRTCAGTGDGMTAVWFPNAPGISFGLASPPPPGWSGDPAQLPDTASVARLWVRKGADDCPAPTPAAPAPPPAPPTQQEER